MAMNITIHLTGGESGTELNALAALIASLGGRAPTIDSVGDVRPVLDDKFFTEATAHQGERVVVIEPFESLVDDHSEQDAEIVDAAVAAGAPSVDSKGVRWDERIHSASRATVADGSWRRRKNTPDETYNAVMAELTGADDAPPPPADDVPNAPTTTAPEPVATAPEVAAAVSASDSAPMTFPQPTGGMTFPQFVQAVQGAPVPDANKSYVKLNELAATLGVGAFKDMKDHADKFDMFLGMLG